MPMAVRYWHVGAHDGGRHYELETAIMKTLQDIVLCSVGAIAMCGTATAQTENGNAPPADANAPAVPVAPVAAVQTITVTGSRVIRNGDSSPSPVTVISADDLLTARPGATLAE